MVWMYRTNELHDSLGEDSFQTEANAFVTLIRLHFAFSS